MKRLLLYIVIIKDNIKIYNRFNGGVIVSNFRKIRPCQYVVLCFLVITLVGSILLSLPISHVDEMQVHFIDALFTAASAVCVTGLNVIDTATHFNLFGRCIIAILIQIGGLGVTSIGAAFILISQRKFGIRQRIRLKEEFNIDRLGGVVRLVKSVFKMTIIIEVIGLILNFIVFSRDYPFWSALGFSAFHTISAFNNAGFDIFGEFQNLTPYQDSFLLKLTTIGLIFSGGFGFVSLSEIYQKRNYKKLSMNTKIIIVMSIYLLAIGAVLLKITEGFSWMDALFFSTSARTAGFTTIEIGTFSQTGLLIIMVLMFIGASPGSTGGGIKITTFFTILMSLKGISTNTPVTAFKRRIPADSIIKAFSIFTLVISINAINTFLILLVQPELPFLDVLFEVVAAMATVGLSTGITPQLNLYSKLIICITMFIGRLGTLTVASIWSYRAAATTFNYPEEKVTIG